MGNKYLPINVAAKDRHCLVVGGGKVALRKINTLIDYGMKITVISPEVQEKIQYYADSGKVTLEKREYRSPEAGNYGMVISACDDNDVNVQVYKDCEEAGVLVNVVDNPPLCNFIFPAVLTRDCLTVTVSSDGKAPFLSSHLKLVLDNIFGNHWNKIAKMATKFRKQVHERWPDSPENRAKCLERFLNANWKEMIKEKDDSQLNAALEEMLED